MEKKLILNKLYNLAIYSSLTIFNILIFASVAEAEEGGRIKNFLPCDTIRECIMRVVNQLMLIVVGVTVVVIIIAGLFYLFSGANVELNERAKRALIGASLGFAIVIGAEIIVNQVGCALGWKEANCNLAGGAKGLIGRAITFLFSIVGIISMIGIIIGGIFYMGASGDESRIQQGKKIFISSVIGLIIAIAAAIIVRQVENIISK